MKLLARLLQIGSSPVVALFFQDVKETTASRLTPNDSNIDMWRCETMSFAALGLKGIALHE